MKIKTKDLEDLALNWAVAKAVGVTFSIASQHDYGQVTFTPRKWVEVWSQEHVDYVEFCPVVDWSQAGPIIKEAGISWHCGNKSSWHAYAYGSHDNFSGSTPLIAAMRCYVASKLGEEIDIPEELLN